ncbi:hypothetical protein M407DRAFT_12348 [Tulasnella calospora MUT 4182]|uniref:Uncharacterized protein n=1 Tax=Tulasnella calospora MUT 4182 TaxID=1051891 RepID=A0A0C3L7G8_9AGAM|nr:hypothetical protein M407DRAFT_12348 [Tulasnella calospora MUT 4182]
MAQDKDIENSPPPSYRATLPAVHVVHYEISSPTNPIAASAHHFPSNPQPHCDGQAQGNHIASPFASINTHRGLASSSQSGACERTLPCSICLQSRPTSPIHLTCRHSICASHSKEFTLSFRRWCRDYPELAGGSITDLFRAGPGVSFLEYQLDNYFEFAQTASEHEDTESEENTDHSSGSSPFLKSPTGSFVEAVSGDSEATHLSVVNTINGGIQSVMADVAVQTSPPALLFQEPLTVSAPKYLGLPNPPASPFTTTLLSEEAGPDSPTMAPQPGATSSLPLFAAHPRSPDAASLDSSSSSGSSYRSYLACSRSEMEEAIRHTEEKAALYYGRQSQLATISSGSGLASYLNEAVLTHLFSALSYICVQFSGVRITILCQREGRSMPKKSGAKPSAANNRHILCSCCNLVLHRTVVWRHQTRRQTRQALAATTAAATRAFARRKNRKRSPSIASTISFSSVSDLNEEELARDGVVLQLADDYPWLTVGGGLGCNSNSAEEGGLAAEGEVDLNEEVEQGRRDEDETGSALGTGGEDNDLGQGGNEDEGDDSDDWEPEEEVDGGQEGSDSASFCSWSDDEDRDDSFEEPICEGTAPWWMDREPMLGAYWELEMARTRKC